MKSLLVFISILLFSSHANYYPNMGLEASTPPASCILLRLPLVGDFNNDGYSDIAYYGKCGNGASDCWRVHLNNKNGQFNVTTYGADMWFKSSDIGSTPMVGDFNNDGYSDIAYYGKCGNGASDCWRVHLNNKHGQFNVTSYGADMWFAGSNPIHTPIPGDFNGDGYSDIAYYGKVGTGADCWRVHLNNKNGQFNVTSYGGDMWFKSSNYSSIPLVGDFNKDGYADIVYYGAIGTGTDCWRVHLNNKNGQFTVTSYGADMWFAGSSPIHAPMVGDFNGDGYPDIAYYGKVGTGADCWRVHLNNKNGQFTITSYGADMWFGDCGAIGECKDLSIQSDNQTATGAFSSESKAIKKAIENWEKKVKDLYGEKYANWGNAAEKDIKSSTVSIGWHNYKSEAYCYGKPCRKSDEW